MVSERNHHSIVPFFNYNSPPPHQFLSNKTLLKKISWEMLIEQIIEFEWRRPRPLAIGVARRLGNPAAIEMLSMTKLWQKSLLFLQFQFLLALVNNIDDQWARVPLNSIFANQFKCIPWKKLRVFFLKFAISGHHLTSLWT